MTDDDVVTRLCAWLETITGVKVIEDHQGGPRPALPYVMVNFTGAAQVRENEQSFDYEEVVEGEETLAAPVIETEWRFSVHAYGIAPTQTLRPVVSASKMTQTMEPLYPALVIHEISQIRSIPDWIDTRWEPRAQMDLFLRGLTRDGFIIDPIDGITPFKITREGSANG